MAESRHITRRTALKGGVILAATAHTAATAPEVAKEIPMSVDDFLAKALPWEIIRYHSNELMHALSTERPDLHWAVLTGISLDHVMVVGRERHKA